MIDTLTRIYALLVCFVCMVCITISTGMGLYELVKMADPMLTLSGYRYEQLSSSERYRQTQSPAMAISPDGMGRFGAIPKNDISEMSDAEVEALRQKELAALVDSERRSATASLIRIVIILLVAAPVFYIHWRISQRPRA